MNEAEWDRSAALVCKPNPLMERKLNHQEQHWAGAEGDAYIARNRIDWRARMPFWRRILELTGAAEVLEVGCNFGPNLLALRELDPGLSLRGIDINPVAIAEAQANGLRVLQGTAHLAGSLLPGSADLSFTAGLLIHIAPAELRATMESIAKASRRYVLAVEYEADKEEEVEYRGLSERLWRRNFGALYEEIGLAPVAKFDAGPGFDRCTAWLMRKP